MLWRGSLMGSLLAAHAPGNSTVQAILARLGRIILKGAARDCMCLYAGIYVSLRLPGCRQRWRSWQGHSCVARSAAILREHCAMLLSQAVAIFIKSTRAMHKSCHSDLSRVAGCRRSTAGEGWRARCCASSWRPRRARARKRRRCRPRRRGWACTLAWASGSSRCCALS